MTPALFDADAFLAMRSLGFLDAVCAQAAGQPLLHMTEFIARRELSSIRDLLTRLEGAGQLSIHAVAIRTPAWAQFKALQQTMDKGEAEAVAWLLDQPREQRLPFVSLDRGARDGAKAHRVVATDLFDWILDLVDHGAIPRVEAERLLAGWLDPEKQFGRPREYSGFFETARKRGRSW